MAERDTPGGIDCDSVSIRFMKQSDLKEIYQMWKTEVWGVFGRKTLQFMFDAELVPNKGFVAEYQGEIIGTGFAHAVSDEIGELGGLFVKPGYRKFGVSKKIWEARMDYLADRNIMAYSLNKRAITNKKLGLVHQTQILNEFIGSPSLLKNEAFEPDEHVDKIVSIRDVDFEQLMTYDSSIITCVDRRNYLKVFIEKYSVRGCVAYKNGRIVGYIDEMPADEFAVVGPWYAESPEVAKALLKKFVSQVPPEMKVHFEAPDSNQAAQTIVKDLGFEQIGIDTILFSKTGIDAPWDRIYSCRCFVACIW